MTNNCKQQTIRKAISNIHVKLNELGVTATYPVGTLILRTAVPSK